MVSSRRGPKPRKQRNPSTTEKFTKPTRLIPLMEFANMLGMSHHWARKEVRARRISFVKVGRRIAIPETEFTRIVQQNLVPARSA